jgi:arylformamidase
MGELVFRQYDQAALDRHYDNAAKLDPAVLRAHRLRWAEQNGAVRAAFPCWLDIAYGDAPGERLDIFRGPGDGASPVQIYIHGGYWISNDKSDCSYVARGFVGAGFTTVVINYDLVPVVRIGAQVAQCRAAIAWVAANIADYGGDPARIYVTGHSAGGHLAVMSLLDRAPVRGVTSLSGLYDLEPVRCCFMQEKLNFTAAEVAAFSPVRHRPLNTEPRLLLAVGELEGEEWVRQMDELRQAWAPYFARLDAETLPGIDHFTMRGGLDDPGSAVCRMISRAMGVGEAVLF